MGRSELPSAKQNLWRRGTTACLGRGIRKAQRKSCAAPQGESVLDASMMADLIESKKEIVSQPKQARRNLAHWAEKPRRGGQPLQ